MKTSTAFFRLFSIRFVLVALSALVFTACQEDPQPEPAFSEDIRRNVPQETIDQVRKMGVVVNEGVKPPVLEGSFWISPYVMTKTDVPGDESEPGDRFVDYRIRLYDQDNKKLSISLDTKGYDFNGNLMSSSIGTDGAYISGNGNHFTVFVISKGEHTDNHSRYKTLEVYSGEKTSGGIKNLQSALVMLDDYGDINDDLIPVNSGRAFEDGDGMSENAGTFRKGKVDANAEKGGKNMLREQVLVKK